MTGKRFIVWVDNGEGWSPNEFDTPGEALKFIASGSTYSPFIITRRLELAIAEKD